MADDIYLTTNEDGARFFRDLRRSQTLPGSDVSPPAPSPATQVIIVELDNPIEADDFDQQAVKQVSYDGTTWQVGEEVLVRNPSGFRIQADPTVNTDRFLAVACGNLGYCVIGPTNPRYQGVVVTEIAAATDTLSSVGQGKVRILEPDPNTPGALRTTADVLDVINRFEGITAEVGTYCKVEWIDGEWQLYSLDCVDSSISASSVP